MAYSASKFQLTHLLQAAWARMGQLKRWSVTGGSTTTVVNTDWNLTDEPVFEDDDPSLVMGTVVVINDAGGAGAAPEGEFAMITDYDSSSSTITMDALTTAVAAGDRVGIATPLMPLDDMINLANIALRKLGEIELVDTSIALSASTYSYTLPIYKRPVRIRYINSDGTYEVLPNWDVIPATAGSVWTLTLPKSFDDGSLELLYRTQHPELKEFDDDIIETIHPEVAINALIAEAYQWYNNQISGSNQYFLQRENKAIQDLEAARVLYPIPRTTEQVQGFPHWTV